MLCASSLGLHVRQRLYRVKLNTTITSAPTHKWTRAQSGRSGAALRTLGEFDFGTHAELQPEEEAHLDEYEPQQSSYPLHEKARRNGLVPTRLHLRVQHLAEKARATRGLIYQDASSKKVDLATGLEKIAQEDMSFFLEEFVEGSSTHHPRTGNEIVVFPPYLGTAYDRKQMFPALESNDQPKTTKHHMADLKADMKHKHLINPDFSTSYHHIILTTSSVEEAWASFEALAYGREHSPSSHDRWPTGDRIFAKRHLICLARLIASADPNTRTQYVRLRTVVSQMQRYEMHVPLWVWNALINLAGKGWRRLTLKDYQNACGVFKEMLASNRPPAEADANLTTKTRHKAHIIEPDIITYTTLIDIAARTLETSAVRHATTLITSAYVPLNRITHLALLRYRLKHQGARGILETARNLQGGGHEIGTDGLNAFLYAQSLIGRVDVALAVYERLLELNWDRMKQREVLVEGIPLSRAMVPDVVTHTIIIQSLAYHGELVRALEIFMTLLSSPRVLDKQGNNIIPSSNKHVSKLGVPILRALFLGFYRQTVLSQHPNFRQLQYNMRRSEWNQENLEMLLNCLFSLPSDLVVDQDTVYWILTTVGSLAGDNGGKEGGENSVGVQKQREVWCRLKERFGVEAKGRLAKLVQTLS